MATENNEYDPQSPEVVDMEAQDETVQQTVDDPPQYNTGTPAQEQDLGDYGKPEVDPTYDNAPANVPDQSEGEEFMMKVQGCIVALIVTSCAEMAQAIKECDDRKDLPGFDCDGSWLWAILVGALSLGFNLLFGLGLYFAPISFQPKVHFLAVLNVLLWGFGVAVITFDKPFAESGNGYFATWGSAVIAVYFAQITFSKFNAVLGKAFTSAVSGTVERRVLMMIMIASYVFAYASLTSDYFEIDSSDFSKIDWTPQEKWGFAAGITSGGLITIYMLLKAFTGMVTGRPQIIKYMSYFLSVWWLFGVGVCTFDAPFTTTGNGYFLAWGSFIASIYLGYVTTAAPTVETPAVDHP